MAKEIYPNCQTVSDILTWSHICELMQAEDDLERSFYEKCTPAGNRTRIDGLGNRCSIH